VPPANKGLESPHIQQAVLTKAIHCQQVKKGERYRQQRVDKFYPQDTPFLTLLPLAPKVFAKQKRFSAAPAFFLQAVESLNVDIVKQYIKEPTDCANYHGLCGFFVSKSS
jgi:hypothetical protein